MAGSGVIREHWHRRVLYGLAGDLRAVQGGTRSRPGSTYWVCPISESDLELAQCGQRSEPSAAADQPLGLLRFRSYWTRVAPHAQVNTATPSGNRCLVDIELSRCRGMFSLLRTAVNVATLRG